MPTQTRSKRSLKYAKKKLAYISKANNANKDIHKLRVKRTRYGIKNRRYISKHHVVR